MKTSETKQSNIIKQNVIAGIIIMQLGLSYKVKAQNELNLINNNNHPNIGNLININGPGPNGRGVILQTIPISIINNPISINKNVVSSPVIVAAVQKKSPTHTTTAGKKKTNHIYKPGIQKVKPVASKSTTAKIVAGKHKIKPIAQKQKPVHINQSPVQILDIPASNALPQTNINITPEINLPVNNVLVLTALDNIVSNSPIPVNTVSKAILNTDNKSTSRVSSGSGSQKKSMPGSKKSKHKRMKRFCYSTNKQIAKFFATSKKSKFDPAACFAWK